MPSTTRTLDTFEAWSLTHWAVIAAAIVLSTALPLLRRAIGARLDIVLAALSAMIWLIIQTTQFISDDFTWGTALPLHVSDFTLLAVPIALYTCGRWSRAILYCWGIALCTLAFLLPDLRDGPARLGFWTFWGGHLVIFAAAIYDVAARGYRPNTGDFARAAALATLYVALMLPFNVITGLNYGYVGPDQPNQPPALRYAGPWPLRVIPLLLAALAAMALVTLPWQLAPRATRIERPPEEWQSGRMRRS